MLDMKTREGGEIWRLRGVERWAELACLPQKWKTTEETLDSFCSPVLSTLNFKLL